MEPWERLIVALDDLEAACDKWIGRIGRAERSRAVTPSPEDARPMHD